MFLNIKFELAHGVKITYIDLLNRHKIMKLIENQTELLAVFKALLEAMVEALIQS